MKIPNAAWVVLAVTTAALAALATGCGDKCKDETPPLRSNGVPSCPTMAPSAPVTVQLGVCPKCDQAQPRCVVHLDNVAQGDIQLEPLSEVCESGSCPIVDPASCPLTTLTCSFTSPAPGSYQIVVVDENGNQHLGSFPVDTGGTQSCPL